MMDPACAGARVKAQRLASSQKSGLSGIESGRLNAKPKRLGKEKGKRDRTRQRTEYTLHIVLHLLTTAPATTAAAPAATRTLQ